MNVGPIDDDHGDNQPRRSTFSPPEVEQDIPLNLGDDNAEPTPPAPTRPPVAPPPVTPPLPSGIPAIPPPPARTSLSDEEINEKYGHGGDTTALMDALQEQVELRKIENDEFDTWATLIRQSIDEETAEQVIADAAAEFGGLGTRQIPIVEEPEPEVPVAAQPVALVEPEPLTPAQPEDDLADLVLPRLGGAAPEPEHIEEATEEPPAEAVEEPAVPAPASAPDTEQPTAAFEQVLGNEDALSPPTDAWPLGAVEQTESAEPTPPAPEPTPQPIAAKVAEAMAATEARNLGTDAIVIPRPKRLSFDYVGEEVSPDNARMDKGIQLFWTWWAVGAPIIGILLGAYLVDTGLSLGQSILASLLGVVLASLPVVIGTVVGVRTGLPTLIASRAAFGLAGNVVPAVVMALVRIAVTGGLIWAASWMVSGILLESNYWNGDPAIIHVITGAIVVVITITLALIGRGMVQVTLWVSAGLASLGLLGVVLVTAPVVTGSAFGGAGASTAAVIAGISVVMSAFMITWAHFGTDLARFHRPYGTGTAASLAALGAVVPPLLVLMWGALIASSDSTFREALLVDFFDAVLELAPDWYPIPAVLVLALPLVGLASMALHSSSYAVISLGAKMPRYAGVAIAGAIAALTALGIVVFAPNFTNYLVDLILVTGVLVAAVVGGVAGEVLTRRVHLDARLLTGEAGNYYRWRIAPVLGFVGAIVIGWGLVTTSIPALSWMGYFSTIGGDLSSWQLGPLMALLVALAVNLLAGIKTGISLGPAKASS
jgi:NCS1 family nucleobase:cation symporter-1